MGSDARLTVGATVHAKAKHVRSAFTCTRLLGSRAEDAMATGIVTGVTRTKIDGRTSTAIIARLECLGKTVGKTLGIRCVRPGPAPLPTAPPPRTSIGSPVASRPLPPPTSNSPSGPRITPSVGPLGMTVAGPASTPARATVLPVGIRDPVGGGTALLLQVAASLDARAALPVGTPVTPPPTDPASREPRSAEEQLPQLVPPGQAATSSAVATSYAASAVEVHGFKWRYHPVTQPIGGLVPPRPWSVRTLGGDIITEGGDYVGFGRGRKPIDYFLAVFPQKQLSRIVELTSAALEARRLPPTSPGEILKLFGVLILATRFEFGSRAELWATEPRSKYMSAPAFGSRTGMPRHRFDALWSALTFSRQPAGGPAADDPSRERYRWALVNDFIAEINRHRAAHVTPGDTLCVDESIIKWYGQGGHWISIGLPMYVAIDRKPEIGCEIQNAACGLGGIMLRFHLVTTAAEEHASRTEAESQMLHGTAVLQRLVGPWAGSDRIVCADSYFASVQAALSLKEAGMRFIGVVKTAHKRFPLSSLAARELHTRGDWVSMVHDDPSGTPDLMAVLWEDRDRRYFVATAGSTQAGAPCERLRWRELEGGAERVAVSVPQPDVAEIYYSCCAQIDRHNRCRQDDLRLEHKLGTHDWSQRVNIYLLGVCIVDAWLLHSGARGASSLKQSDFYENLAADLIDNTIDGGGWRPRGRAMAAGAAAATFDDGTDDLSPAAAYGVGVHLKPTSKRRQTKAGAVTTHLQQRHCRVCKTMRSTLVCSVCRDPAAGGEVFL